MVDEEKSLSRRAFLGFSTWIIGGILALGLFVPGLIYIVGPAFTQAKKEEWVRLGSTQKVEPGTPTLFTTTIEEQTGWITNEKELSVFVYTENNRDYIAMSNICTHLGCRVRWIANQEEFFCPCHNGVFDKEGNVVSGPPPRPLDQYEVKVEGNSIYIKVT